MSFDSFTNFRIEQDEHGVLTAWLDVPERGQNIFDESVMQELTSLVETVEQDDSIPVIIFRSGKESGFLAGADVSQIESITDPEEVRSISELGQQLFDRIERLPMPTVAVIHGPCLGGGLEFALACTYRIARDDSKTRLGLPEIELGILPAWGGTQRLPRQIGLSMSLGMILQGQKLPPRKALKLGLVDRIFMPTEFDAEVDRFVQGLHNVTKSTSASSIPQLPFIHRFLDHTRIGRALVFRSVKKRTAKQAAQYPAVPAALDAVERGLKQSFAAGLAAEREAISRLLFTPTCRSLIGLFFQRERARSGADWVSQSAEETTSKEQSAVKIGVIGGGVMGGGIVQLAAGQGFSVVLKEISQKFADDAMARIIKQFDTLVKKGRLRDNEATAAIERITPTVDWDPINNVDIVIEAATEREDLKRQLFTELDQRLSENSIIATNTSALSVKRMAESTARPDRVAGLHFFNPVHRMQLVEVVRTDQTSDDTTKRLLELVRRFGKTPVVVADSPGFLVNRVLFPYLNEGMRLVIEGKPADRIDREMKRFGMPMGPLQLLDQVGLDVAAHVAESMSKIIEDTGPTAELLKRLVDAGRLGKKSGSGFYTYKKGRRGKPAELPNIETATTTSADFQNDCLPEKLSEIQQRLVLSYINEAARCLDEKIIAEPWMVDLAMVFGTGFAPFKGGPLRVADGWGIGNVVDSLNQLEQAFGPRFAPSALLVNMRDEQRTFFEGPKGSARKNDAESDDKRITATQP